MYVLWNYKSYLSYRVYQKMFKKETVTLLNTLYRISASEIQMESLKIGTVLEKACKKWHKNQKNNR